MTVTRTNDDVLAQLLPARTLRISQSRVAGFVCYVCGAASPLGYTIRPVHAEREHSHTVTMCHACLRTIMRDLGRGMEREVESLLDEVEWQTDDHPRDAEAYRQRIAFLDRRSRELMDLARDPTDRHRDHWLEEARELRTERKQHFAELTRLVFAPDDADELLEARQLAVDYAALPAPNLNLKRKGKVPDDVIVYRLMCENLRAKIDRHAANPDPICQFVLAEVRESLDNAIRWVRSDWQFTRSGIRATTA
jgi:hypothetical protein